MTGGHRFGSEGYAIEELIAELGSAFLCADLEISNLAEDHASYIATWLNVLAQDNRCVHGCGPRPAQPGQPALLTCPHKFSRLVRPEWAARAPLSLRRASLGVER